MIFDGCVLGVGEGAHDGLAGLHVEGHEGVALDEAADRAVETSASPVQSMLVSVQPVTAGSVTVLVPSWAAVIGEGDLAAAGSRRASVVEVEVGGDAGAGAVEVEVLGDRSRVGVLDDLDGGVLGVVEGAHDGVAGLHVEGHEGVPVGDPPVAS